jgi:hypothetical protein
MADAEPTQSLQRLAERDQRCPEYKKDMWPFKEMFGTIGIFIVN